MKKKPEPYRRVAENRRARHEYLILEELECGIALVGTEVKSLRAGQLSLQEAFCTIRNEELFLVGAHIPEYSHGNIHNHKPVRDRKLLANKREIKHWVKKVREKGITIVPLEVYFAQHLVKVRIGLCQGKKLYDKRAATKERDDKRAMDRAMSRRR